MKCRVDIGNGLKGHREMRELCHDDWRDKGERRPDGVPANGRNLGDHAQAILLTSPYYVES